MNPHHGRGVARPREPLTPAILDGRAWTARLVRNNCLRQHGHALARTFRTSDFGLLKHAALRLFTVLETRSRVLFELHPNEFPAVEATLRVAAYHARWIRSPEDWQPQDSDSPALQWSHLLRHLFARHAVPAFLDAAWLAKGTLDHFERDCWCALAQGQSLRTVCGFPRTVSGRVLHQALQSTSVVALPKAIWEAQLNIMGASPELRTRVMASRVPEELSHHALWTRVVAKFIAAPEDASERFELVANCLIVAAAHRSPARIEQLLVLPLCELIRHSVRFVAKLLSTHGHLLTDEQVRRAAERRELAKLAASTWKPIMIGGTFGSKVCRVRGQPTWTVEELCSVQSLETEGEALNHCVARYARRCRQGSSAIFSVRQHSTATGDSSSARSLATVEVHPQDRKIVQIRSSGNRPANNTCMRIIREWASANELAL